MRNNLLNFGRMKMIYSMNWTRGKYF